MRLTELDLARIRNLGKKSIQEIIQLQQCLNTTGDFNEIIPEDVEISRESQSVGELIIRNHGGNIGLGTTHYQILVSNLFNEWVEDVHIDDLRLSTRPTNALLLAGIQSVQKLLNLSYIELSNIDRMGKKSVEEILTVLYNRTQIIEQYGGSLKLTAMLDYYHADVSNCSEGFPTQLLAGRIKSLFHDFSKEEREYVLSLIEMNDQQELGDILECYIYADESITKSLKNYILSILDADVFKYTSIDELLTQMPMSTQRTGYAKKCIDDLIHDNRIEQSEKGIRKKLSSILDYIGTISNPNYKEAILGRMDGHTLEEVGMGMGVTRERVRQIVIKVLSQRPRPVREDEHSEFYTTYDFSKEEFTSIFQVDDYTWNYLGISYKAGDLPIEKLLENRRLDSATYKRAHRIVYKDYLHLNGMLIKKNRREISQYLIKMYCKDTMGIEDFHQLYHEFINEHGLGEDERIQYPLRTMENAISDYDTVVWQWGRKLRYYPMKTYDFESFFERINLQQYHNVEISTYRIFCDYPELMAEYDIRNEYELHNIIKKIPKHLVSDELEVCSMPYLGFGEYSREMQILEMLIELAPISREELAESFEKKYGHLRDTVSGYFSKIIGEYYYEGMYRVDENPFSPEEFGVLRAALKEEFYFLEEIKRIFLSHFPAGDVHKVNGYNIQQLGFKVNRSYAYSNSYVSADAYFRHFLTKSDTVDLKGHHSNLWNIPAFFGVVQSLREEFELIEHSPSQFINYRRLAKFGITKECLKSYIADVIEFAGEQYFTVYSLRQKGFKHPLDDYRFDDWLYESLIRTDKRIKCRRFKEKILLKKQTEAFSFVAFTEEKLQQVKSMDIYDFIDWVEEDYGIRLSKNRFLSILKSSHLYYDEIMEKVYLNYEIYYEEI